MQLQSQIAFRDFFPINSILSLNGNIAPIQIYSAVDAKIETVDWTEMVGFGNH